MTQADIAARTQHLHIRSFGAGPRPVLALHCTIAHSGAWRGLAAAMEDEVTIHAPDMLCHGRSPDWDGQGDFHDRMTEAVMEHLTERMDIVGHSFGATLALRIAAQRPEMVRSLTIIETVHFAFAGAEDPAILAAQQEAAEPFNQAVLAGEYETAARLFNGGWGDDAGPSWEEQPEQTRAAMIRGVRIVPHCSPAIIHDRPGLLKPGALDRVSMPVLLLRGGRTQPIIAATHDALARRLPDMRNRVVEGAGHMLPVTHPAETAAEMRALFAET